MQHKLGKMETDCTIASLVTVYPNKNFLGITYSVYCPLIVISNLVLITAFIVTKQATKNTSNLLIMCVSFSDLVNGAVIMPMFAYIYFNPDTDNTCTIAKVLIVLGGTLVNFSAILTVLLAIDRYLHMNPDIQNKSSKITKVLKISNIGYLVTILFSLILAGFLIGTILGASHPKILLIVNIISFLATTLYILLVTWLYIKGYKRIQGFTDTNPVYQGSGEQPKYVRNLYKTVLILVLLVSATFIPNAIAQGTLTTLILIDVDYNKTIVTYFLQFSGTIIYINNFTSSLVVFYLNKQAKTWILKTFRFNIFVNDND